MSNELKKQDNQELNTVDDKDLVKYLDLFQSTSNLSQTEKEQFIQIAKMSNLNPFKREIYITAYGQGASRQCSIITGYEVYIKRAELSGLLDGWSTRIEACRSVSVSDNGSVSHIEDIKAVVTIHRKDFSKPFIHEVKFSEYVQKTKAGQVNKFWKTKPETMLKKVAISQGFRMCFNDILGGMPYTKDEMLDEQQTINVESMDISKAEKIADKKKEALSALIDCDNEDKLKELWDFYPEIQGDKEWKSVMNRAKKDLLESTENKDIDANQTN